jgi:hypothetical protein
MVTGDLRMVSDFERRWPMIFACHEIVEINNQGVITDLQTFQVSTSF